jgi:hypothetical protein
VGYNVQMAVDAEHHLIVAHEVTHDGLDRDQLSRMAEKAKGSVGKDELTVVADRGYLKSEEILVECIPRESCPRRPEPLNSLQRGVQRLVHEAYVRAARDMGRKAGAIDRPNIT